MQNKSEIAISLHAKQGVALETPATEVLYGGSAGGGKALALDTPLATPFGWTTMAEVSVGDILFDENGRQCSVVATTAVMVGHECYRVTFSDGSSIVADAGHEWQTFDALDLGRITKTDENWRANRRAKRPSRIGGNKSAAFTQMIIERNRAAAAKKIIAAPVGTVKTTKEIADTLTVGKNFRLNHAIPVSGAIQCDESPLLIDPYVLGAWLGDRTGCSASITSADAEILDAISACGHEVRKRKSTAYCYGILGGLQVQLRSLGVLNNKHIPAAYLRASEQQRLSLLQGLMDTDGHANDIGHCEFSITRKILADHVSELLASLGIKSHMCIGTATLNGRKTGKKYTLKFLTEKPVFRLSRKLIRQKRGNFRGTHSRRYIKSVERVPSVPVRCVQVDSPSHLYLAGASMIPTHNSFLMRAAAIMWCGVIPKLQVYLFRRLRDDLVKNHIEGPQGLRLMLQPWVQANLVVIVQDEIRFWNGSKIYLCHCQDEKDRYKYLGSEIHFLIIDELTTFSEVIYRFLRSRVRMAGITLPPEHEGKFPRILCGSNPGNLGHGFVKAMFIDPRPPLQIERMPSSEGGMLRQYIPAKLSDNPSVDPAEYTAKLEGLGSPELVRAMRDGDWNVVAGAFFPEFFTDLHVIEPLSLPKYWHRFRSFDWGSARPFSVGWYAVSDGELAQFPRGALIRYREWYGAAKDASGMTVPNKGLRMTAEEVADGIAERERPDVYGNRVMAGVADPAIFTADGGPSIADRMAARKVFFRPADNARVARNGAMGGWDQVRARLKGDGVKPAIYFFSTCVDLIRTLPAIQHDEDRPEDCDSDSEDHAVDELRYACASRPFTAPLPSEASAGEPDRYKRRWKPTRHKKGSAWSA